MVGGSLIVGACLVVLGWTAEIVGLFVTEEGMVRHYLLAKVKSLLLRICWQKRRCTIALAVLSIYAVDFAINAGELRHSLQFIIR